MSRWTAVSDYDYDEEQRSGRWVDRTCKRCGHTFSMAVEGDYKLHVVCDGCYREILATQERKIDEAQREEGAA